MRLLCTTGAVLLIAAGGCGGGGESGACADAFRWRGRNYVGTFLHVARPLPAAVGRRDVVRAPCHDGDDSGCPDRTQYDESRGPRRRVPRLEPRQRLRISALLCPDRTVAVARVIRPAG